MPRQLICRRGHAARSATMPVEGVPISVRRSLPKQANPAADEASPAAVGKLLLEATWKCTVFQASFSM